MHKIPRLVRRIVMKVLQFIETSCDPNRPDWENDDGCWDEDDYKSNKPPKVDVGFRK